MAVGNDLKGIVVQFGGDTTQLKKALEDVNSTSKKTQDELKQINRQLKFDPKNTVLLSQKHQLLGKQIGTTKEKLETLKAAQDQFDESAKGTEEGAAQYRALQREIEKTEGQLKSLQKQYDQTSSWSVNLSKAGEALKTVGGKISGVGDSLTTHVTAPLAAVGVAGVKNFAEVDKVMSLTDSTMGNTGKQAQKLRDAMKSAAAQSVFGMQDAATATLNFARAGLKSKQAADALAPAMNLAAGEGGDLDTVSQGLVATINGFHGTFDQAGQYADIFASACNNSALDIDSLSNSMSVAAPIFSAAGYSVKDATLALGLMGNAGIDANVAANSLKTGLARLVSPAQQGAEALQSLGFNSGSAADNAAKLEKAQGKLTAATQTVDARQTKYNEAVAKYGESSSQAKSALASLTKAQNSQADAQQAVNLLTESGKDGMQAYGDLMVDENGNMRSFQEVLSLLQQSFGGLSEEQQIQAASAIFGKEQMSSWLALINSSPDSVDSLSASLENASGATDKMAKSMMSGFGGSIESLKSGIDVLSYSVGETIAPKIQGFGKILQDVTDKLNAMDPKTREAVVSFGLFAAAIGPVLAISGRMITSIGSGLIMLSKIPAGITMVKGALTALTGGISTAVKAFGALAVGNPLAAVVIGISAAVIGFTLLYKHCEPFRKFVDGIGRKASAAFKVVANAVKNPGKAISSFGSRAGKMFSSLGKEMKKEWDDGAKNCQKSLAKMGKDAQNAGKTIAKPFKDAGKGIRDAFDKAKSDAGKKLDSLSKKGKSTADAVVRFFAQSHPTIPTDKASRALNQLRTAGSQTVTAIRGFFSNGTLPKMPDGTVKNGLNSLKSIATGVVNGIKGFFRGGTLPKMPDGVIKSGLQSIANKAGTVRDAVKRAFNGVKIPQMNAGSIKSGIGSILDKAHDVGNKIKSYFRGIKLPSLPRIKIPMPKLPVFHVNGGRAPWGIGGAGVAPSFSVTWKKDAMNQLQVLDMATIIGQAKNGSMIGAGEAGREVVGGEAHLLQKMYDVTRKAIASSGNVINGGPITVNVYSQPGMDERRLAEYTAEQINRAIYREEAAIA